MLLKTKGNRYPSVSVPVSPFSGNSDGGRVAHLLKGKNQSYKLIIKQSNSIVILKKLEELGFTAYIAEQGLLLVEIGIKLFYVLNYVF